VQGCGKSLACRTVARTWGLPLLRLDAGRLFDKYVGESEKNLRKALETAEAVAPVILWVDEIEKAFASGSSGDADGGLSKRLFGAFLTWLQEKSPGVFVAATANDLSAVPPELLRKGRFDEIFFVDLPDAAEREAIFALHLARRKPGPNLVRPARAVGRIGRLQRRGDRAGDRDRALRDDRRPGRGAVGPRASSPNCRATVPLSRSRREDVEALRSFAAERFVPAR
jgi:SpoVK/Ycf46/Vps4 family AAA+-type ATPase